MEQSSRDNLQEVINLCDELLGGRYVSHDQLVLIVLEAVDKLTEVIQFELGKAK